METRGFDRIERDLDLRACPCCKYLTLETVEAGSYEICPVCGWEDDLSQFEYPNLAGGANCPSLEQARRNFLEFGASEKRRLPRARPPKPSEIPPSPC